MKRTSTVKLLIAGMNEMYKLVVKVPKENGTENLILKGYSEFLPQDQQEFSLTMHKNFYKIIIDFGMVYNIKKMTEKYFLVQTENSVIEVSIDEEYEFDKPDNVIKFSTRRGPRQTPASNPKLKRELVKLTKDINRTSGFLGRKHLRLV
jgi:hypothetical protein